MEDTQQKTMTLEVYDPAMCCSTGVCGPDVDDDLMDFANDVKWLKSQGVEVRRYNLGQEPEAFKSNAQVISRLQAKGSDILPILVVNGSVISEGAYPGRNQLLELLGINNPDNSTSTNEKQQVLVTLKQAVVAGDIDHMRDHFRMGEELGISTEKLVSTIQDGINDRQRTTTMAVNTANELLGVSPNGCRPGSGCC